MGKIAKVLMAPHYKDVSRDDHLDGYTLSLDVGRKFVPKTTWLSYKLVTGSSPTHPFLFLSVDPRAGLDIFSFVLQYCICYLGAEHRILILNASRHFSMRFSTAILALASAAAVTAQQTYTILVGSNGTTTFSPPYVNATTGDKIAFQFVAGNHTVTQSTFNMPCENNTSPMTGIDSGFQPVASNASMYPQYSFTMTNSNTMWFYCRQTGHCEKGMVFAVNPTEQMTFQAFQDAAEASGSSLSGSATMSGAMSTSTSTTNGAVSRAFSSAFVTIALGASLGNLIV